jgi:hypothetical protein
MATADELFDALMKNCKKPGDLIGENGLLKRLSGKYPERTIPLTMREHPIAKTIYY